MYVNTNKTLIASLFEIKEKIERTKTDFSFWERKSLTLCVALNDGVRYNKFTIKYLEIENHEFQLKIEISLLEFVVFIF